MLPTPDALPNLGEFMAEQGMMPQASQGSLVTPKGDPKKGSEGAVGAAGGVGNEMRELLVNYCAHHISATQLEEVRWGQLAKRLGTHGDMLEEVAKHFNEDGSLWQDVLSARIRQAHSSRIFRDTSWERLESLALNKLGVLMEKNLIRDSGELLAIASAARRANTQSDGSSNGNHTTVNVNLGDGAMSENGLPAAGAKMTLDLTPRVANALQKRAERAQTDAGRVIDGEMLSAGELRDMLTNRTQAGTDALTIEGDTE